MERLIQREALENHPFFARIYDDIQRVGHDYNGKMWSIEEFLYNLNELLRSYLLSGISDKHDFYDSYTFKKYKDRFEGHQFTIEFQVSWIVYYQDYLEVRLVHLICLSDNFAEALKFMLKGRKAACKILEINPSTGMSMSADEIFIDKPGVLKWCDELFGIGSDSQKVWKWLQQEYKHLRYLSNTNPGMDGIKLLNGHITPNSLSLSYLLEYVLKDFLPDRKRYINRLYDFSKQMEDKHGDTNTGLPSGDNGTRDPSVREKNQDFFNYSSANPKVDTYMLNPNLQFDCDSPKKHKHQGSLAHSSSCKKCNIESNYYSEPNLNSQGSGTKDDGFGVRHRRRKLLRDISKMNKDLIHKKIAIAKALALCRAIEPLNVDCKKKIIFIQRQLANLLNDSGVVPPEDRKKFLESCGMDTFEPYDKRYAMEKLFKDFLNKIQDKGVRVGKEFREIGIPCANKLDELVQELENSVRPDLFIFRKKREDSPTKGANMGSPSDNGGIYPYIGRNNGQEEEDYPYASVGDKYDTPNRNRSRQRSKDRSLSPEMQPMDDDYLADSIGIYEYDEDPNNDFIAAMGDRKELTKDAANYDTNELGKFTSNENPDQRGNVDEDYVIRMHRLTPQKEDDNVKDIVAEVEPQQAQEDPESSEQEEEPEPTPVESQSEDTEIEDIDPEVIIPDPILKYVEVEVKPPPKEKREMKLDTIDLYIEPEPYEPPVIPPKPDMEHKEVDAVPLKPELTTQATEVDRPETMDRSMECDIPDLFDKDVSTDTIKVEHLLVQTDAEKVETREIECETDKPVYKSQGFVVKTDPIKPIPKVDHFMITDVEKLAVRTQLSMASDPIKESAKTNMTMKTDTIKKREKTNMTMKTDAPKVIQKTDLKMMYEKPKVDKKDFDCDANPDFIQDLIDKAKQDEVAKERERVAKINELKRQENMQGKPEIVQSGTETEQVFFADKNLEQEPNWNISLNENQKHA